MAETVKPDQERVKNLLTDTVTLLCKNGLTFSDQLRIEGLLGVSIDNNDVFFVHISEKFCQNPPEQNNTVLTESSQEANSQETVPTSPVFTAPASPAPGARRIRDSPCPSPSRQQRASPSSSPARVKPEPAEDNDDLLIVEEPKPEVLEKAARQATMVAGQRRAQRREHSPSQQQQSYHGGWDDIGEPPAKRRFSEDDQSENGSGFTSGTEDTSWPNISSVDQFNPQFYQQDPGGAGFDTTTPGCSTWPTTLPSHSQSQESDQEVSTKRWPENALSSGQMRNALSQHLVQPVLHPQRKLMAFRLVWTSKQCSNTEEIWQKIIGYQKAASDQMKLIPGIEFFICTITATTSTGKVKTINPALGFWVAIDTSLVHESQIYISMRNNGFGAELKIMTHKSVQNELELHVHNVSMIVKDYVPGFIQNKVLAMVGPNERFHRERLYIRAAHSGATYPGALCAAQQTLAHYGLQLYMETY